MWRLATCSPFPFPLLGYTDDFFPGFKKLFISLFLAMLNLFCCASFSLVVASGGYSLVVVRVLLTVAASLVARGL